MKRILIIAAALLAVAAILWAVYSVIQKSTKPKRPAVATIQPEPGIKERHFATFQGELPGAESGLLPGNGSQRTEKRFPVPPEEDEGAFPPPLHFSGPAADAADLDGPIEDVDRVEEDVVVTFTFIETWPSTLWKATTPVAARTVRAPPRSPSSL